MTTSHSAISGSPEDQALDANASVLMKSGIRLMQAGRREALLDALECFDRARQLRARLPIESVPIFRYGLAACWLNRAEALTRFADAARLPDALHAYDEGIALLVNLPFQEDARFSRRLALAFQNRGITLLRSGPSAFKMAIEAFSDAMAVLDREWAASISDREYLRAAVWMNTANARVQEGSDESWGLAREAAHQALALIKEQELSSESAAEIGLHARHVLCHTIARSLSQPGAAYDGLTQDVYEATDVADEGLDVVRQWEQRGVTQFRSIACDLFRFGARVYARYQPQFVDEFIQDNMDPVRSSPGYVELGETQHAAQEAQDLGRGAPECATLRNSGPILLVSGRRPRD